MEYRESRCCKQLLTPRETVLFDLLMVGSCMAWGYLSEHGMVGCNTGIVSTPCHLKCQEIVISCDILFAYSCRFLRWWPLCIRNVIVPHVFRISMGEKACKCCISLHFPSLRIKHTGLRNAILAWTGQVAIRPNAGHAGSVNQKPDLEIMDTLYTSIIHLYCTQ